MRCSFTILCKLRHSIAKLGAIIVISSHTPIRSKRFPMPRLSLLIDGIRRYIYFFHVPKEVRDYHQLNYSFDRR